MSLGTLTQKQAKNAISRYGAPVTISRPILGDQDPTLGGPSWTETSEFSASALMDFTSTRKLGLLFGSGGLVQSGDGLADVYASNLPFEPAPGDVLTFRDTPYTIVEVRPTFVGELPVLFSCLVRK